MGTLIHRSTVGLAGRERLQHWNRAVAESFPGCSVEHRHERGRAFNAAFWCCTLGSVGLMRAQADRSIVSCRTGSGRGVAGAGHIKLHLQHRGFSETRQHATTVALAPGDLASCDLDEPFSVEVSDHSDLLMLDLPADRLMDAGGVLPGSRDAKVPGHVHAVNRLRHFMLSVLGECQDTGTAPAEEAQVLERILVDLVVLALRPGRDDGPGPADRDECRRIMAWIDDRLGDPGLCTAMIAAGTGRAARTLQGMFARMGTTPTDYVLRRRLERAKALLGAHGAGMSVCEIAFEVGFNDSSYFTRRFRHRFGMTPSEFRAGRTA